NGAASAQSGSTASPAATTGPSETPPPAGNSQQTQTTSSPMGIGRPLVVIDPAHGGSERGAALTDTLLEKNITLGFARLLRHELEQRGYAVLMLRDGDDTLTLDQRAGFANAAH